MGTFTFCACWNRLDGLVPVGRLMENVFSDEMELIIAAELKPRGG
jgi:hypothetical protein